MMGAGLNPRRKVLFSRAQRALAAQLYNPGKGRALPQRFQQRLGFVGADGIRCQFQEFI
jgi:hypothetical protein